MREIFAFLAFLITSNECLAGNRCSTTRECLEYVFTIPGHVYCKKNGGLTDMFVKKQKVVPRVIYVCKNGRYLDLPHY